MKAAICTRYGPPEEVIQVTEVEKPVPRDDEVLIKVRAASLNPADWHLKRGTPVFIRLLTGLRRPKDIRLGFDVAGRVDAVGNRVTQFRPGHEVFGTCRGAFAEFACAAESDLVAKPVGVTFEQAASAPVVACTALQGLRDHGRLQPGQQALINGAAGGVGMFAVQVAKWLGAVVTGVCSARNLELVRSLGADQVIDYTREDFTKGDRRYDLIFDLVANHSLLACRRVLNPGGVYLGAGVLAIRSMLGIPARWMAARALSLFVSQKIAMFVARASKEDLALAGELMATGKVTPIIDRRYGLTQVAEAVRHLEGRHARAKVVITLE